MALEGAGVGSAASCPPRSPGAAIADPRAGAQAQPGACWRRGQAHRDLGGLLNGPPRPTGSCSPYPRAGSHGEPLPRAED